MEPFPGGLHVKPEPGGRIRLGWAFNRHPEEPVDNPQGDVQFAELVLRGASRFLPGLAAYLERIPTPIHAWAGYYSRTAENWPLVGPLSEGVFTVTALSGFGTMMAMACAELCSAWICDTPRADYSRHFSPARYEDLKMVAEMSRWSADGQL